jgi:hypothetical protein
MTSLKSAQSFCLFLGLGLAPPQNLYVAAIRQPAVDLENSVFLYAITLHLNENRAYYAGPGAVSFLMNGQSLSPGLRTWRWSEGGYGGGTFFGAVAGNNAGICWAYGSDGQVPGGFFYHVDTGAPIHDDAPPALLDRWAPVPVHQGRGHAAPARFTPFCY